MLLHPAPVPARLPPVLVHPLRPALQVPVHQPPHAGRPPPELRGGRDRDRGQAEPPLLRLERAGVGRLQDPGQVLTPAPASHADWQLSSQDVHEEGL